MGQRGREHARRKDQRRSDRIQRGGAAAVATLGVATALAALFGLPWWVATSSVSAALWFGYAAFAGRDALSAGSIVVACGVAVAGTLMARGAWEVRPFKNYSGDFVVVGGFVIQGGAAPMENAVGPSLATYHEGDYVTVECKTSGLDDPKTTWYRLNDPDVYLPETKLVPSTAEPPGPPPDC